MVVPARDEQARIERCLDGVLTALARLPCSVDRAVCVVLDRCTDDTATLEAGVAATAPVTVDLVTNTRRATVGALRHDGMCRVLAHLGRHSPARTWLLSTDADTLVGPTWALDHLRHARAGAHAVAGLAGLDERPSPDRPPTPTPACWPPGTGSWRPPMSGCGPARGGAGGLADLLDGLHGPATRPA